MKVFQIENDICHWQTPYTSLDETIGKYPESILFVEAPDYVFEGWGYMKGEFIKPQPPEGWLYDDATGTFYKEGDKPQSEILKDNKFQDICLRLITDRYPLIEQFRILCENLNKISASQVVNDEFGKYEEYLRGCIETAKSAVLQDESGERH